MAARTRFTWRSLGRLGAGFVVTALLAGLGVAQVASAQADNDTFYACLKNDQIKSITTTPRRTCPGTETLVTWNEQGPQGLQGPPGEPGPQGPEGTSAATTGERAAVPGDNDLPNIGAGELLGTVPLSPGGVLTSQSYLITATVWVGPSGGSISVTCDLAAGGPEPDDTNFVTGSGWTPLVLETVHTQSVFEGTATVRCHQSPLSHAVWDSVRITALEVGTVTTVALD